MPTRETAVRLTNELTSDSLQFSLSRKMLGLLEEPEFEWLAKGPKYRDHGGPVVKVAVANTGLEADIWEGLKNPAMIGLYPLGLPEIWEYYARVTATKVDENGRTSIFPPAKSFAWAKERYGRAVLISIMFPLAEEPLRDFADLMDEGRRGPLDYYNKWWTLMNLLLERAMGRMALELMARDRAVIVLTGDIIKDMSSKALPLTRQGEAHGPSKGGNFPHKSLAALTGLGQFGINRLIIRDEPAGDQVERFLGPIRSIVIFDHQPLDNGIALSESRRKKIFSINDFRIVDTEVQSYRFCSYTSEVDGCRECLRACPSGALTSSSPLPSGQYPDHLAAMKQRFFDGFLQFNFNKCNQERVKPTELYSEWACSRCFVACAVKGKRAPSPL